MSLSVVLRFTNGNDDFSVFGTDRRLVLRLWRPQIVIKAIVVPLIGVAESLELEQLHLRNERLCLLVRLRQIAILFAIW